jgi:hypothetical protein
MPARYAVLPSPPPTSGLRKLLFYKIKHPTNRLESTLLQVLILDNLKPFGINTFEKQGEGCQLWLTKYYKMVSLATECPLARQPFPWPFPIFHFHFSIFRSLPSSVHTSKFRILQPLCLPLSCPERCRRIRKHPGCGGHILQTKSFFPSCRFRDVRTFRCCDVFYLGSRR